MHPRLCSSRQEDLRLLLSAVGGSGGATQLIPDGRQPAPGGWNHIQIEVKDLAGLVEALRLSGVLFRNDVVRGNSGKQILLEGPSGNPIEPFESYRW